MAAPDQVSGPEPDVATVSDPFQHQNAARTVTEVGEAIALRASSVNSHRCGKATRLEKSATHTSEKENKRSRDKDKTASRRSKTGGAKGEGLGLSLLSLFR